MTFPVTRRSEILVVVTAFLAILCATPATADASDPLPGHDAQASGDGIDVHAHKRVPGSPGKGGGRAPRVVALVPGCSGNAPGRAEAMCAGALQACPATTPPQVLYWVFTGPPGVARPTPTQWTPAGTRCLTAAQVPRGPVPELTLEQFRRLALPPGRIHVQPATGRTLVNVPTNVMVDARPATFTTTVLGATVRVRATPTRYTWTFGDGTHLTTTDPGAPYPDLRTTHTYLRAGTYPLTLATTYRGQYSVNGGPWQPVNGTATVPTPPTTITAAQARAHLIR